MKLKLINSVRTNNFNDKEIMDKIKALWEDATRSLQNYQNSIFGVYFDYESNYKGDYSLAVAIEDVEASFGIPDTENYTVFKVDTTDKQGIFKAWSNIWQLEEHGELNRAYTIDFEKYHPNGDVEIHIAVK
ncbi:GyrI-like domain-containing protein [Ferdinandcohnia quinoae]|uniref:Effector binding domain-containing protein n=1 Tax=Fredinandcohnia quinoae TaxID=2918902 RepID=A0AAW5E1D6_9BACI|nr:effector binding domain-containing protein [Fredinandcohnia sp. SECRCQ15]MCH1626716.1 effector binding domain-containing protein [Fredinandcohnia sp. SECRCQ15]